MSIKITERNIKEYTSGPYPVITAIEWDTRCPFDPDVLANFPNLQHLNCSHDKAIDWFDDETVAQSDQKYESLQLRSLTWLSSCPQLQWLRCRNNNLQTLEGIENCPLIEFLDCSGCGLVSLTQVATCPRLRTLNCFSNRLTNLAGLEDCKQLQQLYCARNRLTELTEIRDCTQLEELDCGHNRLTSLCDIQNCAQLSVLDCDNNLLTALDWIVAPIQLRKLRCDFNKLTSLAGIELCSQLELLYCISNKLTSLEHLVYLRQLRSVQYGCNPLAIQTTQVQRYLTRFRTQHNSAGRSIYTDGQNVHDITVQKSVCDSMRNLLTDTKPEFSITQIVESGMDERAIRLLLEYCEDASIHSMHLLTYIELLSYVWARISRSDHKIELVKILGEQILDAECKCFTGRFNRTLSVLVGFYPDIVIEISDNSRIGAIILAVKDRLGSCDPKAHREHASKALLEAGYDEGTIEPWLEAITGDDE